MKKKTFLSFFPQLASLMIWLRVNVCSLFLVVDLYTEALTKEKKKLEAFLRADFVLLMLFHISLGFWENKKFLVKTERKMYDPDVVSNVFEKNRW